MRKIFLLLGVILLSNYNVLAQINGQTPSTALKLCNTNVLSIATVPAYWAGDFPGSCLSSGGLNPMFYIFNVSTSGTLGFNITPLDSCSDYDFQLFNVTNQNVNNIYTNAALSVSCNYSGLVSCSAAGSVTGCGPSGTSSFQDGLGTPINSIINATAGQIYLLCVSNFDETAPGYTINFTGTASIFDTTRPKFDTIVPVGCNSSNCIDVQYVDNFLNSSVDANGSCYNYSPAVPGTSIVFASCLNCTGGVPDQGSRVRICFNQKLPPGTYTLFPQAGNDGNTIVDYCDNEQFATDSIQFTITGGGVPTLDSATNVGCDTNFIFVKLNKYVQCATVAGNGSDFMISGPQAVTVFNSTPVACVGGLTNTVRLSIVQGANPYINVAGTYTIYAKVGSDGNTIVDTCGQEVAVGDSVLFNAVASVLPNFVGYMDYGCLNDTLYLVNNTLGASTHWWDFGNGDTSVLFQPTQVYPHQDLTYTVTYVGSNPNCTHQISHNFNFSHSVFAEIQLTPDSICAVVDVAFLNVPIHGTYPGVMGNNYPASYFWNHGNGGSIIKNNFTSLPLVWAYDTAMYSQGGIYTIQLIVTDTIGCKDTAYQNIWVDSIPYSHVYATDSLLCVGESIYLHDTVATHSIGFDYVFSDGYAIANQHNPIHLTPEPGNYYIVLTSYYTKCNPRHDTIEYTINNFPNIVLGKDTMICPGITGPISLIDNNNLGAKYLWNTGDQTNSIIVTEPGIYWLQATDVNGCSGADTIEVKRDCYISIPNAFTPNGDNQDDFFIPRELLSSGLKAFSMNIYNRWGEQMFTTSSIDGRGWDGNWNGKPQPNGVYMYEISTTFKNGQKKKFNGSITLLR